HNGVEVLRRLADEKFDVILMDGQMPEMDGYQASTAIRQRERESGEHVRIVAVTAHALKGDRERCFAAGMDAYVSKPIRPDELLACVEQWDIDAPAAGPGVDTSDPAVFDHADALRRARGKPDFLRELVAVFIEELPRTLEDIKAAAARRDFTQVERTAHRLVGAAANLGARSTANAARLLEHAGVEADPAAVSHALAQLERQTRLLAAALARLPVTLPVTALAEQP
ncbi:MAG TPA: response regulator, partial [Rubrivivax sp.]|nr:response regulator [Rubrivivax sp.]